MNNFENMLKFAVNKNSKYPAVKWSKPENYMTEIDTSRYNVGLLTGPINNIIVVDVDAKNNGIEEMEKYYTEYGLIKTVKQITPSGGYHLIFKYTSSNNDDQFLIDNYLKTKSLYRNVGIDIRSKGGFIVFAPSIRNNIAYELVADQNELLEMPHSLIEFLLGGMNKNVKLSIKENQQQYSYNVDDKKIIKMLTLLDDTYHNNTKKWLIITNILKGLNKFNIWNDWSTMSKKYNYDENMTIWENTNPIYDINYLSALTKSEPIARYKPYNPMSKYPNNKRIMNAKYIQLHTDELTNSDTIIMKSCTGTGKTTTTAQAIKSYNANQRRPKRILSIISKKSLAKQHIKSFSDAGINLSNYLDKNKKIENDNIVCCINSIMLFRNLNDQEFSNYIVYIDEISSFLNDVSHNETLRGKLKLCYQILMRIVKNCHKLILSDAKISDNVINFIRTRQINKSQTLYIENSYKKYQDVSAKRIRDEQLYLDMLIEHVQTNNYFLCSSDSCTTVSQFYTECRKYYTDMDIDEKFILITSENYFDLEDASEQFENKFVFYSPSIIFGVDFSIEQSQDVFVYNKGLTIDPSAIFQQTTRTRNIRNLYYFSELANADPQYENLESCKQFYSNISTTSQEINEVCGQFDEDDNEAIVRNTFFEIFTYNEYVLDIYRTNKTAHYENILKSNGFLLSEIGQAKKLTKSKISELNQPLLEIKESLFNELIETGTTNNDNLNANLDMLQLKGVDTSILIKYKDQITDKFKFEEYLNIIRCLKDEEYIQQKIFDLERDNYNITNLGSTYHKIKHVIWLENKLNIKRFEVDAKVQTMTYFEMSDVCYKLISKVFRISRKKPTNIYELQKLYISMIRNITCSAIIEGKQTTEKKMSYKLNKSLIIEKIELNKYSDPNLRNYDPYILTILGIEKPISNNDNKSDPFTDDVIISNNKKFMDYGLQEDD